MRKLYVISLALLISVFVASAIAETGDAGQAGPFIRFGMGARALGMGGAYCSIAEGVEALYYNPAGIALNATRQVELTYHSLSLDRNLNSGGIVYPIRNETVLGFLWLNSSISDVPMIDSDREYYDDLDNSYNSFALTFSKALNEQIAFGASLRYIQATLDILNAYTIGIDLGAIYKPLPNYSIGFTVNDLGSSLRWDSSNYWSDGGELYDDDFPYRARFGGSGQFLDEHIVVSADIMKVEYADLKYYGGAEYWFIKKVTKYVEDYEAEDELKEITVNKKILGLRGGYYDGQLTFGAGFNYPIAEYTGGFDYAFMSGKEDQGSYHVFSLKVAF